MVQSTPQACIVDLTIPTFAGIQSLTLNQDGSLTAAWNAGTTTKPVLKYNLHISKDPLTVFNAENLVLSTKNLSARVYTEANQTPLQYNTIYYMGVRAEDALGFQDSNTVTLSKFVTRTVFVETIVLKEPQRGYDVSAKVEKVNKVDSKINKPNIVANVTKVVNLDC